MNIVLLGPPGAGKGTQAQYLEDHYGMMHISTGDLLRKEISLGSDIGLKAKEIIDTGGLVSDDLITSMIEQQIMRPEAISGFIFDGYPRTIHQAISLDKILEKKNEKVNHVIEIQVEDQELIKRISGRFACHDCGTGYNDFFKPTLEINTCDICGGHSFNRRADDTIQTATERLKKYYNETAAIIPYYIGRGILVQINGMEKMQNVKLQIDSALGHA